MWPNMNKDTKVWCKECEACQKSQIKKILSWLKKCPHAIIICLVNCTLIKKNLIHIYIYLQIYVKIMMDAE